MEKGGIKQYLKKNWLSTIMVIGIAVMLINPNAKTWVLRQLMHTGIFNAHIGNEKEDNPDADAVDLKFLDEEGRVVTTTSLKGKVVFINFWASWCPPCRAEMPSIQSLYEQFDSTSEVAFLMVNEGESHAKARSYLKEEQYSWPYYKVYGNIPEDIYKGVLPTTVVLDKQGKVRYHHKGFANYSSKKFIKQMEDLIKE